MEGDNGRRKFRLIPLVKTLLKSDKLIYLEDSSKWLLIASGNVKSNTKLLSNAAVTSLGVLLMSISARTSLITPFTEVPFTFQTLVLIILTLLLRRDAWKVVTTYLMLGLAGLPVFAYGGGLQYLMSPTTGYLIGFLTASLLGYLVGNKRSVVRFALLSLSAIGIVYLFGWMWLSIYYSVTTGFLNVFNSMFMAFTRGVLPFIAWDVMKALIASLIAYEVSRATHALKAIKSLLGNFLR